MTRAKAREGEVGGAPAAPTRLEAEDQEGRVRDPDDEGDRHDRVEAPTVGAEAGEADGEAEGENRKRDRDRLPGERVERSLGRSPLAQDPGHVALQPPLLPQVERGQAGGECEAREGRENQADVKGEEDISELAPALPSQRRPWPTRLRTAWRRAA